MENKGEDQQTQQGPSNGNCHMSRSMREYMHPQMIGVGSCIVLHNEPIVIKTHMVPHLPQFHGMGNENPYTHIKDFEEVCHTFHEGNTSIELMRLNPGLLFLEKHVDSYMSRCKSNNEFN